MLFLSSSLNTFESFVAHLLKKPSLARLSLFFNLIQFLFPTLFFWPFKVWRKKKMIKNSVFLHQIQLFKTSLFFLSTFSLIKREKKWKLESELATAKKWNIISIHSVQNMVFLDIILEVVFFYSFLNTFSQNLQPFIRTICFQSY